MPRSQKNKSGGYDKAFPRSLRGLLETNGTTKKDLATHLNKSGQAISYYCDGTSSPDWETIVEIAKFFSVSTDYLLGLAGDPAPAPSAVDDLGLSPKAVLYLRTLHEMTKISPNDTRSALLSYLFENRQFDSLLSLCGQYVKLMATHTELSFEETSDYRACSDVLKEHGFVISPPDVQANALFSERITNLLRSVLDKRAEIPEIDRIAAPAEQSYWTDRFRSGLATALEGVDLADAEAAGFDLAYAESIASEGAGFTFEDACQLCCELGYSPDDLLNWKEAHEPSQEKGDRDAVNQEENQ